jgi:hypothetical protein
MGQAPKPGRGVRPVSSRGGGISVTTTERGLPIGLKISARELSRTPQDLANEIMALCQLSAVRQQVARRRNLVARGVGHTVIRSLNLATEEDLAEAEAEVQGDDETPPGTWMRSL